MNNQDKRPTRRKVLKGALYAAPAILTLVASPSFAKKGCPGKKSSPSKWDDDWD